MKAGKEIWRGRTPAGPAGGMVGEGFVGGNELEQSILTYGNTTVKPIPL